MTDMNSESVSSLSTSEGDTEAIRHLQQAIAGGKHWYLALLEAIGLWTSAEEVHNDRTYHYLIEGEAFDWLLLAERLCWVINSSIPDEEKNALLFHGNPPLTLSAGEVKEVIGSSKYRQLLNYFYGVIVEGALLLVVQEEVDKERQLFSYGNKREIADEAYQRIYGAAQAALLNSFRQEKGYSRLNSTTITELKEFSYWLFKYRLKYCEKAKVASDTKKALQYLKRQWTRRGFSEALVTDESLID